jgi:transcriptional regulator with XRE-family HTH domain
MNHSRLQFPKVARMADLRKFDLRRRQLGMSRATLARRAKVSVPTVHRILTGKEPAPSLATVEALADALGMAVQILETIDAEELRERQAKHRAAQLVGMVQATMGLESQAVDRKTIETLTKRNATRLLAGSSRRLWDE